MLKIAICDDDKLFRNKLLYIVEEYLMKENIKYKCDVFNNGSEFLKTCDLEGYNYNIIFQDILMDDLNGIEVAKKVKAKNPSCEIVFVTITPEFIFESLDSNPFNYLVKPANTEKVTEQIQKIVNKLGILMDKCNYLKIKQKGSINLINPKDIIYVDTNNKLLTIHCTYDTITFNGKIDSILESINEIAIFKLIKCHRSYLVNPFYIEKIDRLKIILTNNEIIPVSRLKYEKVKNEILEHYTEEMK